MLNQEDIEYIKNTFNVDLSNKSEDEINIILEKIENDLNQKIVEAQKENLRLEKEIIQLMSEIKTDN